MMGGGEVAEDEVTTSDVGVKKAGCEPRAGGAPWKRQRGCDGWFVYV